MKREFVVDLIENYFIGWKNKDINGTLACLHENIKIYECYGAFYETKQEVKTWFNLWHKNGGQVIKWDIIKIIYDEQENSAAVDWVFHCYSDDDSHGLCELHGCSTITFKDNKIIEIKEYEMKKNKFKPYVYEEADNTLNNLMYL